MFLCVLRQLHRLPKMEGNNRAANHKQVYPGQHWKRVLPLLLLLILLWGALSASLQQQKSPGLANATVSASGLLQGSVYNLNQTGGSNIIKEIDVTQGQYVRQGQVLARLDPTFLQRAVDAAQALVDVTQYRVNVSLERQARAVKEQQALVALAETNFNVAQNILQADKQQAEANIKAAQVTLTTQQQVLATVKRQAELQIQVAQAQLDQSIASCQAPSQSGTPTPASHNTGNQATTQTNAVQACIHRAQIQYQQVVATAQTAIVTAQVQVTRAQAAITQATANANVTLTAAQGQVAATKAQIAVATYAQDLLVAARELAESRQAYVGAAEQLHTAQLNLTTNTVLVAPHDGVVTAINGTVGGVPGPRVNIVPRGQGSADSNVFVQLVDPSHVDRLLLNVNETDITKVKAGQHVQFTLNAYADREFSGTVSAISPNGVFVDNMMKYPVTVSIAPESLKGVTLFPNMTTATVSIVVG